MRLELVVVPASDVDVSKAFYERAGFIVDVDHRAGEDFRIVQLTPPGSSCSIALGTGFPQGEPGSVLGLHLVVQDLVAARATLRDRGLDVGEVFHQTPSGRGPGVHPDRLDYASFAVLDDPDGNSWLLQEVGFAASAKG